MSAPTVAEAAKTLLESLDHHARPDDYRAERDALADALLMADRRAKFEVCMDGGIRRVAGYIVGSFGIDRRGGAYRATWHVTHLRTGRRMDAAGGLPSRAAAEGYARALEALCDWSAVAIGPDNRTLLKGSPFPPELAGRVRDCQREHRA